MFDILPWKRKKENRATEFSRDLDNMYDRFLEPHFLSSSYLFGEGKQCFPTKFEVDISTLVQIIIFSLGGLLWQKAILRYWVFHQMPL